MLDKLRKNALFKNISWIFVGNMFYALFHFLLGIYTANQLTLNDNGVLNYAKSYISIFSVLAGFGFSSMMTRFFAKDEAHAGDYLCTGIVSQTIGSIAAIVIMQVIVRALNPGEGLLYSVVLVQSTSISFSSLTLFIYWFQYKNKSHITTILRITTFLISAAWRIVALSVCHDLMFYVYGVVAETLLYGIGLWICYARHYHASFRCSLRRFKDMLKASYPFITSGLLGILYSQTDTLMLKGMMDNAAVALYSVSLTLAGAISTLPMTLIEGFRPEIMQKREEDIDYYRHRFRQLYGLIFWGSMAYCLVVTLFAKEIILLLYGQKYIEAAPVLSLIVWYSTFTYYGSANNMYMVAEDKSKWVQVTTLIGGIINVALNYFLIPQLGVMGAALATLITQFTSNFVVMAVVPSLRPGFKLMIEGIALHWIRRR